jgi:hypothetical protein
VAGPALFAERQASSGNPLARGYTGAEIQIIVRRQINAIVAQPAQDAPTSGETACSFPARRGLSAAPLG